jgi:predicted ATPase
VQAILQEAERVKLLVTSRAGLELQSEWAFEVEGLGNSATELFVQSARRVRAGFTLNAEERPQVERICQLVGAMPLGIELAASWVRVLPLNEIAGEIERNLDFLTTSARDVPARHRSMRAVFDQSWQLLTDEERRGLERLSVFRGGFRREAAEQVAGVSLSLLSALLTKSLLHRTATGRYDLHELVRQYAAARLHVDAAEEAQTHEQHSRYYADWLQQHDHTIRGAAQPEGATIIRAEIDNIRLAWQWAIAHRQVARLEAFIYTLFWFYDVTNRFGEGIEVFQQAAEPLRTLVESLPDPPTAVLATFGHLLAFQGWFTMRHGRLIKAKELLSHSVILLRPCDAPVALSDALRGQGFLFYLTGDIHNAQRSLAESLAIKRSVGDDWEPSFQLVHQGVLAYTQGDYQASCQLLREALAIVRRLGYSHAIARALVRLSTSTLALGRHDPRAYDEAQELAEESLQLSQRHQDVSAMAHAYNLLGVIAQNRGDARLAESISWFHKSLTLYREIGDHWSVARVLNSLGDSLHRLHDPAAAVHFREAAATAKDVGVLPPALDALAGLAAIAFETGELEQALLLALAVQNHAHSSPQAKERVCPLCQTLVTQFSGEQVEAMQAKSANQPLERLVEIML